MIRILSHPITLILAALGTILICASLYFNIKEIQSSETIVKTLNQEVDAASNDVSQAKKQLKQAQLSYSKEKLVRDQLLMQKPGEYIVQIPDLETSTPAAQLKNISRTPWQEWLILLGFGDK